MVAVEPERAVIPPIGLRALKLGARRTVRSPARTMAVRRPPTPTARKTRRRIFPSLYTERAAVRSSPR
jgi:hypothetical protein